MDFILWYMRKFWKILSREKSYTHLHFLKFPVPAIWKTNWKRTSRDREVKVTWMNSKDGENTNSWVVFWRYNHLAARGAVRNEGVWRIRKSRTTLNRVILGNHQKNSVPHQHCLHTTYQSPNRVCTQRHCTAPHLMIIITSSSTVQGLDD